jgi:hypothetical protein
MAHPASPSHATGAPLNREDAQQLQFTGHVDPDPLLLSIQQMGDLSQMLNPEIK